MYEFMYFLAVAEDFKRDLFSFSPLKDSDVKKLEKEADHIYRVFCEPGTIDHVDIGPELLDKFKKRKCNAH